jgi:uncharacterized membrane protein
MKIFLIALAVIVVVAAAMATYIQRDGSLVVRQTILETHFRKAMLA